MRLVCSKIMRMARVSLYAGDESLRIFQRAGSNLADPDVLSQFIRLTKSSLSTYQKLITDLRLLPGFSDNTRRLCERMSQITITGTLHRDTYVNLCKKIEELHQELVRARNGYAFLVLHMSTPWNEIPASDFSYFHFDSSTLRHLKGLHRTSSPDIDAYISKLREDLRHDDAVLSRIFPVPLNEEQLVAKEAYDKYFMPPPNMPLLLRPGLQDQEKNQRTERQSDYFNTLTLDERDRYTRNLNLREIGFIQNWVPAENLALDDYFLNCGQFIDKVLRNDKSSVTDPRILKELAYSSTSFRPTK